MKKELKLFVGGYYDDRVFEGDLFQGKTPFNKDINTYTLSEALELSFVSNVIEWYSEHKEKDWNEITEEEKIKVVLDYIESDEIAGLLYFETEEKAEQYKKDVIKEVEEIEKNSIYNGKIQDEYGYFREVYIEK